MSEALLWLLLLVIAVTVAKSVIRIFAKAVTDATQQPQQQRGPGTSAPQTLQKDPVCGTFVAVSTQFQKTKGGSTYYFCSAECRDKF